ncbi:MAG: MFS transporter [Deltaproteobacteria bacterium]|nr:MFS transporter [Deltaproteobacteria bacterium]
MEKRPFIFGLGRNVFFAGLVSLFMDMSSEMIYPLLPIFLINTLGASKTALGVIEGVAEATASLLKIASGWLSDRFGGKKLLMAVGYGVSTVSRPMIAGAGSWADVFLARFVDRTGKGVRGAPRDAIIADSTEKNKLGLAFGFHRAMDTTGAIIGPAIAFILLLYFTDNLRLVFLAAALPGVLAVATIIFFIKEKRRPIEVKTLPSLSIQSFDGQFRLYLAVIAVFSLGNFADAFIILRAHELGVRDWLIPIVYLSFNVVYAAVSIPMGILGDRIGLRRMVLAGFIYFSIIFAGFAASNSALHIWILFPLFGAFKGMSEGVQRAYLASLAPPDRKATAFGVYHAVVGLCLLPASIIAGFLWDRSGAGSAFFFGSGASMLAAFIFVFSEPRGLKTQT